MLNRLPGQFQLSTIGASGLTIAVAFLAALIADRFWDQPVRRVLTGWLRPTAHLELPPRPASETPL